MFGPQTVRECPGEMSKDMRCLGETPGSERRISSVPSPGYGLKGIERYSEVFYMHVGE